MSAYNGYDTALWLSASMMWKGRYDMLKKGIKILQSRDQAENPHAYDISMNDQAYDFAKKSIDTGKPDHFLWQVLKEQVTPRSELHNMHTLDDAVFRCNVTAKDKSWPICIPIMIEGYQFPACNSVRLQLSLNQTTKLCWRQVEAPNNDTLSVDMGKFFNKNLPEQWQERVRFRARTHEFIRRDDEHVRKRALLATEILSTGEEVVLFLMFAEERDNTAYIQLLEKTGLDSVKREPTVFKGALALYALFLQVTDTASAIHLWVDPPSVRADWIFPGAHLNNTPSTNSTANSSASNVSQKQEDPRAFLRSYYVKTFQQLGYRCSATQWEPALPELPRFGNNDSSDFKRDPNGPVASLIAHVTEMVNSSKTAVNKLLRAQTVVATGAQSFSDFAAKDTSPIDKDWPAQLRDPESIHKWLQDEHEASFRKDRNKYIEASKHIIDLFSVPLPTPPVPVPSPAPPVSLPASVAPVAPPVEDKPGRSAAKRKSGLFSVPSPHRTPVQEPGTKATKKVRHQ